MPNLSPCVILIYTKKKYGSVGGNTPFKVENCFREKQACVFRTRKCLPSQAACPNPTSLRPGNQSQKCTSWESQPVLNKWVNYLLPQANHLVSQPVELGLRIKLWTCSDLVSSRRQSDPNCSMDTLRASRSVEIYSLRAKQGRGQGMSGHTHRMSEGREASS